MKSASAGPFARLRLDLEQAEEPRRAESAGERLDARRLLGGGRAATCLETPRDGPREFAAHRGSVEQRAIGAQAAVDGECRERPREQALGRRKDCKRCEQLEIARRFSAAARRRGRPPRTSGA